jgi:hypothetical protein
MKRNNYNDYSDISSIEEIRFERTRLKLREKILESRISLDISELQRKISLVSVASSFARSFVLPKVSDLIASLLRRFEDEASSNS